MIQNHLENCTHPVPPNQHGIIAMHCFDNRPIAQADLKRMFDGPIGEGLEQLREELSQPISITPENPFSSEND